jgi:O-antigen/teichoic acid export membrane protein
MNAAGASLLGFIFWMIAPRMFSADEIGVGASLINAITLLSFFSTFGIQIGLLRFISLHDQKESFSLLNSAFSLVILSSVILGFGFAFSAGLWSDTFGKAMVSFTEKSVFTLFVVFWSIHLLLNAVFIAKKRSKLVFLKDTGIFSVLKIALLFPLIFLGTLGIVTAWGFGILIAVLVMWILFLGKMVGGYRYRPSGISKELKNIVNYSVINYIGEIFRTLPTLILPILAVHLVSPENGGYFFIAWMIANVIFYMVYMFTLPLVVEGAENMDQITSKINKSKNFAIAVFTPGIIVLLLFPGFILELVGGSDDYREGALLLRVLAISVAPFIINNLLVAKSRIYQSKDVIWIYGLSTAITISLGILWFPLMGIVAGGWAWLLGQIVVAVIFGIKEFGINRRALTHNVGG